MILQSPVVSTEEQQKPPKYLKGKRHSEPGGIVVSLNRLRKTAKATVWRTDLRVVRGKAGKPG